MEVEVLFKPSNAMAKITLGNGENCVAESGSMVAMSGNLNVSTSTHKRNQGNILKSVKRLFAGESFFLNHYNSSAGDDTLYLSTDLPGDMIVHELNGESLIVQSGSFVASDDSIDLDVGWQGFKSMFSGESLFWLNLKGRGKVILNSFGAIYEVDVEDEYIVDTGHIVAFEETLNFEISKAGSSWLHSFMGGEGLVCKFKGKGKLWCQSHNPTGFGSVLGPLLKARQ